MNDEATAPAEQNSPLVGTLLGPRTVPLIKMSPREAYLYEELAEGKTIDGKAFTLCLAPGGRCIFFELHGEVYARYKLTFDDFAKACIGQARDDQAAAAEVTE